MAIPSVNQLSNIPGGGLNAAMSANNKLANEMHVRKYNQIKAQYAPETLLAQAASQAAYANNIAPQYMAKMLQDAGVKGNLSDAQLAAILQKVHSAGMNGNPLINTLNQRLQERYQHMENQNKNPLSWMMDKFKSMIHPEQQQNALAMQGGQIPSQNMNAFNQQQTMPQAQTQSQNQVPNNVPSQGAAVDENGNQVNEDVETMTPVTPEESASLENLNQGNPAIKSYLQGEAGYKSGVKQGEQEGSLRAKDRDDIGRQNLALSTASTNLDSIIKDFNDPVFENLRSKIPNFQKAQLSFLKTQGTPEEQEKIGKFIGDIKQYASATVNSFRGPATGREFNFANDLKPSEDDTIPVIRGKSRSLKELNKIAYKKNQIISQLMDIKNKNPMSLTDAVEEANKRVDISKIQKDVNNLVNPQKIATQEDIDHMAEKYKKSPEEIKRLLKEKGIKYGG